MTDTMQNTPTIDREHNTFDTTEQGDFNFGEGDTSGPENLASDIATINELETTHIANPTDVDEEAERIALERGLNHVATSEGQFLDALHPDWEARRAEITEIGRLVIGIELADDVLASIQSSEAPQEPVDLDMSAFGSGG